MKMKKIDKNPAKLVRNPKRELRHPTALNVDQMFTLLDEASVESGGAAGLDGSRQAEQAVTDREHAGHTRDLALAELLYGSGLRISEALDKESPVIFIEKHCISVLMDLINILFHLSEQNKT